MTNKDLDNIRETLKGVIAFERGKLNDTKGTWFGEINGIKIHLAEGDESQAHVWIGCYLGTALMATAVVENCKVALNEKSIVFRDGNFAMYLDLEEAKK